MTKPCIFLALSLLVFGSHLSLADEALEQNTDQTVEEQISFDYATYAQEFAKSFGIGAAAGVLVEFLRSRILPDITHVRLHARTGICRDQLTGEAKVIAALLGTAALHKTIDTSNWKMLCSQLLGIIAGSCSASYVTKIVTGE
ncbi:MAG: hypothetical protein NTX86_04735 [Candidatus Dependentiae bacterium]|nr:hypothetical protein [Candidatus Dependentiae bacterium]